MVEQNEASKAGELEEDKSAKKLRSECDNETHQDFLKTCHKVLQIMLGLSMLIKDPKCTAELAAVVQKMSFFKMNKTIHKTRLIDATKLRLSIGLYVAPDPYKAGLDPPIINSTGREEMGLKHPVLAQFICPADQLEQFMANPEETRKLLECRKIRMRVNNFPTIFWSGDRYPGENYDAENMCKGLFQGYMLIRVCPPPLFWMQLK
ncbi:hypothetical protein J3R82DRAFT_6170 [Butyriboletus roseoflavus]|nr:hypothetical protein J3R82DRAFT_6170 [Butyriboletus roseoflavus]